MNQETRIILAQAAEKVRQLRRHNEILGAKAETMEMLSAFLFSQPPRSSMGTEEDIAWRIDKHLQETKDK